MIHQHEVSLEGRCSCGSVHYRLNDRPLFVHCCHCTWCQRETGSAFAVNALIEASKVEILKGDLDQQRLPSASGKGQIFSRCSRCDVTLWSNYAGTGNKIHFIRVGTLDHPARTPPDIHIYTSTKLPWIVLPKSVPTMEAYYERSEYWQPDCLRRYKVAVEKMVQPGGIEPPTS